MPDVSTEFNEKMKKRNNEKSPKQLTPKEAMDGGFTVKVEAI